MCDCPIYISEERLDGRCGHIWLDEQGRRNKCEHAHQSHFHGKCHGGAIPFFHDIETRIGSEI